MTLRMTWLSVPFFLFLLSNLASAQDDFMEPSPNNEAVPQSPDATVPDESPPSENNNQKRSNTVGLLVGYAIDFESYPFNPYGVGLGVRGGHTFDFGLYLGGKFLYFVGGTDINGRHNETGFSLELGYDFEFDPITVRPSMDFGVETHALETRQDYFFLGAGISFIVSLDLFFIALDVRYLSAFDANPVEGMAFMGNLGIRY
jgi:hypothetical protein